MNCKLIPVDNFRREAKRLTKKYSSLKDELSLLGKDLLSDPRKGTALGSDIFKIRIAVKSKGKGKSGGVRVITRIVEVQLKVAESSKRTDIYLLSIYDKSEFATISDKTIKEIVSSIEIDS